MKAKTTLFYQIRIYAKSTCVHIFLQWRYFMCGWKSPTRMFSDMDAMFYIVPGGYLRGPSLKKKWILVDSSFIRGKSVKAELKGPKNDTLAKRWWMLSQRSPSFRTGQLIYFTSCLLYFIHFILCLRQNIFFSFKDAFLSLRVNFSSLPKSKYHRLLFMQNWH